MAFDIKIFFDSWVQIVDGKYRDKQWMLSKWENIEGVDWPPDKIELMLSSIKEGLELKPDNSVVDLGCGGGWIQNSLSNNVGNIAGVDFSFNMLKDACTAYPNGRYVCGNANSVPLKGGICDKVLCYFVFINMMDDADVENSILEILRILKDGGRALIGQLPDEKKSDEYDNAKQNYLSYCEKNFKMGRDFKDVCRVPQKLFNRDRLSDFLKKKNIKFCFRDSFNPFHFPGQKNTVGWRFDLILDK